MFGDQPGQFEFPRAAAAVSADPAGGVYVADAANNRVQSFDATGKFLKKWGISGRGASYLTRPEALAPTPHGNIYVADTGNDRVQEFDPDGRYLGEWDRLTGRPAIRRRAPGWASSAGRRASRSPPTAPSTSPTRPTSGCRRATR